MKIAIKNAKVLLTDGGAAGVHTEQADIAIDGDSILAVGTLPGGFAPDKTIDGTDKLAMPGLVNAHTHTYMTIFRNYADDVDFDEWLFGRIQPKEDLLVPEDAYWGAMLGCMEMIKSGTTCFLDMHLLRGMDLKAAADTGMRAVFSRGLVGSGPDDAAALRRIEDSMWEREASAASNRLHGVMLGPHAIYTCDEAFLRHVAQLAAKEGLRIHTHLSETVGEVERCKAAHGGKTPPEYLESIGFFTMPTVAAHCVHLEGDDIAILKRNNVSVATNPISNMKLGNGFAPVPQLLEAGVNVCVGTDGCASNNNLNMFKEMSVLSLIHKGTMQNSTAMPAKQTLLCGTQNGANALGLGDITGSIAPGKRADIALIDLAGPEFCPPGDLATALVYSGSSNTAHTVLIDGKVVMENGAFPGIDTERVYYEVNKVKERIL